MLDLLGAVAIWLKTLGEPTPTQRQQTPELVNRIRIQRLGVNWLLPPDPETEATLDRYLQQLANQGFSASEQGVWLQSGNRFLGSNNGNQPLPAASLTKAATSLATLQTWNPDHQFLTQISATGPIQNGTLRGDLVIQGGGDPLLVWEEAFGLGNALNRLGIKQVAGNLVVTGPLAMNYETDPLTVGTLLREALDHRRWSEAARAQFATLPPQTPRPQVAIAGNVLVAAQAPVNPTLLITHRSLPLGALLRQMNIFSNNPMAEMLAENVGGVQVVAETAAIAAGVPTNEIQLMNGSGLGTANRISPRAVIGLFQAIQRRLQPYNLTIADVFPMAGREQEGTVSYRKLPQHSVVKTGTLWNVSALAGVIPTQKYGTVWFAIQNYGDNLEGFRQAQERLLQALVKDWGRATTLPPEFRSHPLTDFLGDPKRTQTMLNQS